MKAQLTQLLPFLACIYYICIEIFDWQKQGFTLHGDPCLTSCSVFSEVTPLDFFASEVQCR